MLLSAHFLIRSNLLSLNPVLFIYNFPVHFFHTTTTKRFTSTLIFWYTTLITLYTQKYGKGQLNKLLPLLLTFWLPSPMPLHDSLSAKRKFESLLYRTPFLKLLRQHDKKLSSRFSDTAKKGILCLMENCTR